MSNVCERAPEGYDVNSCVYQKKNCRMQCLRESQIKKDQELMYRNDLLYSLSHFLLQESPIDETDTERILVADTIKECMRAIEEAPAVHKLKAKWYNPNPPGRSDGIMCDRCGFDSIARYRFCPGCGSKMEK